ncbi:hypothetical protein EGW08_004586, partial [Elysia chlorotica]
TGRGVKEQVWLDGFATRTVFRPHLVQLDWNVQFRTKFQNFFDPAALQKLSSPFSMCVVMDPQKHYKWVIEHCFARAHPALCYIRTRECTKPVCAESINISGGLAHARNDSRPLGKQKIL